MPRTFVLNFVNNVKTVNKLTQCIRFFGCFTLQFCRTKKSTFFTEIIKTKRDFYDE